MTLSFILYTLLYSYIFTVSHSTKAPEIYAYYDLEKSSIDTSECKVALENFANSASNYTQCAIKHSHPIHACELCVDSYTDVIAAHNAILTTQVNDTKCRDVLINLDRLEIVETTYSSIKSLWGKGHCDKCFDWTDGMPTLSNKTEQFISYFNSAKNCINNHTKDNLQSNETDQICKDCMTKYLKLNSFYESLKEGNGESFEICMDIVDSMNATRSVWSDVLNCCKLRKTPELVFLCCTGIITGLPVIFYLLAKLFCERATKPKVLNQNRYTTLSNCPPSTSISGRT